MLTLMEINLILETLGQNEQTARLMMDNCEICSNVHGNLCMVMKKKTQ